MSDVPAPVAPIESGFLRRRFGGAVHLHQDRGTSFLSWFFGGLIVAVMAGLFFGRFARTESVRGYVSATSGLSRLDAQANGVVARLDVKQGDPVHRGQRLMQIDVREQTSGGVSIAAANKKSLEERQANLNRDSAQLAAYLKTAAQDRTAVEANVANVFKAMDEQEKSLQDSIRQQDEMVRRVQTYLGQGYATRDALNTQRRTLLEYQRQLAELRARRAQMKQETDERLRVLRVNTVEKTTQLASMQNELSSVKADLAGAGAQSRLDIVAPVDGQVAGLYVEVGASVSPNQVLAIVGDENADPLIVLEVPARAIGLAKVGQDVVLKYDAFPFKTFGIAHGTITGISASPLRSPAIAMADVGDAKPDPDALARQSSYRIEVTPKSRTMRAYGIDEPIRIGSTLSADIVVERRRLIDWVLDPIRAMRGRG